MFTRVLSGTLLIMYILMIGRDAEFLATHQEAVVPIVVHDDPAFAPCRLALPRLPVIRHDALSRGGRRHGCCRLVFSQGDRVHFSEPLGVLVRRLG